MSALFDRWAINPASQRRSKQQVCQAAAEHFGRIRRVTRAQPGKCQGFDGLVHLSKHGKFAGRSSFAQQAALKGSDLRTGIRKRYSHVSIIAFSQPTRNMK